MENNQSVLQNTELDDMATVQLEGIVRWAYFISIIFFILCGLTLVISVFLLANISSILPNLAQIFGWSQEVEDFILSQGMILGSIFILIGTAVLFLNGFFLLKFRNYSRQYALGGQETSLAMGFDNLYRYMMLSAIINGVSLISGVFSIIFILSQ